MAVAGSKVDPFTFEVLRHKFWQITDEMGATLVNTSGSPVVTEVMDIATGIFAADGEMVSMGNYVMLHLVAMQIAVQSVIDECGDDPGISENDMFILNDPYRGALHEADVVIAAPIHHDGDLVGWAACMCHQLDIGGLVPGGISTGATDVYQEGLRLSPVKFIERGKLRKDIWNAILNNVRLPIVGLDFKAQIAANNVAKRRLRELCQTYGVDIVKQMMGELLDFSESKLRERLRELPDGAYRHIDRMDHDGLKPGCHEVMVALTKKDDHMTFDFTGTGPQAAGFINCCIGGTWGGLFDSVLTWLCYDIPWNAGLVRPIELIAPCGTLVNPNLPAPVSAASVAAAWAVRNATEVVLSKMLGCSPKYRSEAMGVWHGSIMAMIISGLDQFGDPYGYLIMDAIAGGCGATAHSDGVDSCGDSNCATVAMPNIEVHEASNPVLYMFRRQLLDSGGAGKYRGGLGIEEMLVPYDTDRVHLTTVGFGLEVARTAGIFGGYPGSCNLNTLVTEGTVADMVKSRGRLPYSLDELGGEREFLEACTSSKWVAKDQVIYYQEGGGGGYGDALDRDPKLVLADVLNEHVSLECACQVYGVAIDPERLVVIERETEDLRRSMKDERTQGAEHRPAGAKRPAYAPAMVIGEYLELAGVGTEAVFRCAKCGHTFGPAAQNPKKSAVTAEASYRKAGPAFPEDGKTRFFLREFYCPGCATRFEVEVTDKETPVLHDIELAL